MRHLEGLRLRNVRLRTANPDTRPAILLDDVTEMEADAISIRDTKRVGKR